MTQQTNGSGIESLEPQSVWRIFAGMAAVPHPSKKEARIRAHVRQMAEEKGLTVREDSVGNMVVEVPASPGCEGAPITVLQGHLDMVCEKNADTVHDFDNDPLKVVIDRSPEGTAIVRAEGTTLGADNGIGVAMALAAAFSPDVRHGPLELLFTIDEEAGMSGAKVLVPEFFRGRRLLNLDAEEDDVLYIGCAGGTDSTLTLQCPLEAPPAGGEVCRVTVSGLCGGHSGGDIHLNRANAVRVLARALREASVEGLRLAAFSGGSLRNAIPREATAVVAGPAGTADALRQAATAAQAEAVRDNNEPECQVSVEACGASEAAKCLSPEDTRRLAALLIGLPCGVLALVPEIPGLVRTSNNVATVAGEADAAKLRVTIGCLSRSSSGDQLAEAVRQIAAVGELAGAEVVSGNTYPGWQPNTDSPLLATCREVYERLFGAAPEVTAIHAGLECGLIGERVGGMDMISFGPCIRGAHSPDERVYIESVQKSWKYLTAVLGELARG